jgi:hypothetical protein
MTTQEVANKLVEMCKAQQFIDAINTLYADEVVSIEPVAAEGHPRELAGKEAALGKTQWWLDNHEVHSGAIEGPFVGEHQFSMLMEVDTTFKPDGTRRTMREMCLYEVADGKIVREEFFYHAG